MPINAPICHETIFLPLVTCQQEMRIFLTGSMHSVAGFDGSNKFMKRKRSGHQES